MNHPKIIDVQRYHVLDLFLIMKYIYMKYEIKNYVVITVLLIGFAGIVTATASKLASATLATSPAPTMITQPTQSGSIHIRKSQIANWRKCKKSCNSNTNE